MAQFQSLQKKISSNCISATFKASCLPPYRRQTDTDMRITCYYNPSIVKITITVRTHLTIKCHLCWYYIHQNSHMSNSLSGRTGWTFKAGHFVIHFYRIKSAVHCNNRAISLDAEHHKTPTERRNPDQRFLSDRDLQHTTQNGWSAKTIIRYYKCHFLTKMIQYNTT